MSSFNVADLFLDTVLADITFVVEDEDIPGHRLVFANASPYFKNMLVGNEESQLNRFQVETTSAKAFKEVKRFIYLGQLDIEDWNIEDLLDLLALAKEIQLQVIFSRVIEALMKQPLDFDSWHSVKSAASIYGSIALEAKCVSFAEEKWSDFLQLKDFYKFTAEFICFMFGCPKVFIDSTTCNQDHLLFAIRAWKMDRSAEELRSVTMNFKKVSKNAYVMMMKEFFSIDVNTDCELQMWTLRIPNLENPSGSIEIVERIWLLNEERGMEPLECIARVDSLWLSMGKEVKIKLSDNKGQLDCSLNSVCIPILVKLNVGFTKDLGGYPVRRLEFEADTKFSLKVIDAFQGAPKFRTHYMCSSGPTSKNGWFKYRGAFSHPTPLIVMHIFSPDFKNMSEIRLRNLVIY